MRYLRIFTFLLAFLSIGAASSAPSELRLADVITYLTFYDLTHVPVLQNQEGRQFWGMSSYYPEKHIWLSDAAGPHQRKLTLLHEFIHVHYFEQGFLEAASDESRVKREAERLYKKLYGNR